MGDAGNRRLTEISKDLVSMQRECSERGLAQSSAWAAGLYASLDLDDDDIMLYSYSGIKGSKNIQRYLLAKSLFDLREYERAAYFLEDTQHPKLYFLHVYCRYLADEKKKLDRAVDSLGSEYMLDNDGLKDIQNELSAQHRRAELDGYSLYLYGIVLRKLALITEALQVLVEAVSAEPLNWSAWLELSHLIADRETLTSLVLPKHWIKDFFMAYTYAALQMNDEALQIYETLQQDGFSNSVFIKSRIALIYYNMRDMDQAMVCFSDVVEADPYRLENMDSYSDILYVKAMRIQLANLAHRCCDIDKYCIESCCVIGNFYSLRGQHEKAIMYFQRGIKLNPHHLSAWILIGHEYIEIKNTSAAIHSYRQALEVNKRDFRAWYGLGQTYEILKMPFYCLYYYRQAHMLKPNDSRMIIALGECYEKLDRLQEAKKCFKKAHNVGDIEDMALIKLARLYEKLSEEDQAAGAYMTYIADAAMYGNHNAEHQSHAYKYLANYHLSRNQLDDAYVAAQKCTSFPETREEAKGLLKQIAHLRICNDAQYHPDDGHDQLPQNSNQPTPLSRLPSINMRYTPF